MNASSDSVNKYVNLCAKHATHTTQLFLGAIIAAVLIVASALLWSNHINNNLEDAKAELAGLNTKLKHTPVILHFKGKDCVRVIPDSETSFSHRNGDKVPGSYAKVWHVR